MTEKKQPPLPADDDEARFDEEGSAVGSPKPAETEPKQKTKTGAEIPVPKRGEFLDNLKRASSPDRKPSEGSESASR
jgi:hypothetical protein